MTLPRAARPQEYTFYRLFDPRTEATRYIGMTRRSLRKRTREHRKNVYGGTPQKRAWLEELRREGLAPEVEILEVGEHGPFSARRRELWWAEEYEMQGARLVNWEASWRPQTRRRYLQ